MAKLKKTLSYLTLLLLFIPLLQSNLDIFGEKPLGGVYSEVGNPEFSAQSWWDGSFQNSKDAYFQNNFGLRKTSMHLRYQWMFWLYSMASIDNLIVGKDGYIFEKSYLEADKGKDFIGEPAIDSMILKTEVVYQKLQEMGKHLLILIAPSKAHYFQEYLPTYCLSNTDKTNYKEYIKRLHKTNIPVMDVDAWFLSLKNNTEFPLFPKTGIHFSSYGAAVTTDSMVRYWEKQLGKDIPDFYWPNVEWSDWLRDEDSDLEWAMNLMYPIPNHKMPYPNIIINEKDKYKPNILTVGDSYFWRFYRWDCINKVYNNSKFLYYNKEVYPGQHPRDSYNLEEDLKNLDAICIFMNPTQFSDFSWGLINDLYSIFVDFSISEEAIVQMIETIKSNPEWLAAIEAKAASNNLSLESMLRIDAKYVLREELKKK